MATVNGVVENVSTKFGKYSIQVNGNWYGTKEEWATVKPNKGDTVEFDDGGGKFMKRVKIVSATNGADEVAGPSPTAKSVTKNYSRGSFPIDPFDGQVSIVRQNALTNAIKYLSENSEATKTVEEVIAIARQFEEYTAGWTDKKAAEQAAKELLDTVDS